MKFPLKKWASNIGAAGMFPAARNRAVMDRLRYLPGALARLTLLLLGISFVSFLLIQLSPSDPAEVAIRINAITPTPEVLEETRASLGLDKPFLTRYLHWLSRALQGDLGNSYVDGKSVAAAMGRALPPTLLLAGTAALLIIVCCVPAALTAFFFEGRAPDILLRALIFLSGAVPAFWAGLLLLWLFAVHGNLLPVSGLEEPKSLVLPAITLALPYISTYARLLRSSILHTKQQNFVLYARTCGRSPRAILRHVVRNSLQTSLAGLGMSLPKLIAGTFVVESIFAWPGLGRLCVTAIFNRDFPVIQAYILLMALLFTLFNALMEACSALADPRLRDRRPA